MDSYASGKPIKPREFIAAYLIYGLGLDKHLLRALMTSGLICGVNYYWFEFMT
jgi:hypothetical protein